MLYPLRLKPFYRHGEETPWGGSALAELFHKDIPDTLTGESLEISALSDMQSTILNGEFAGRGLCEAVAAWGSALTGLEEGEPFPLLVKLLDARMALSVQVHPGDEYAAREGKLGKTEAWMVLSAPPGARLVYGLDCGGTPLSEIVESGQLEEALNWIQVSPGDVLYIPSGLVHALGGEGAGDLVVYEIQQSSDLTYRFWDWGRVDAQGRPRELHTEQALSVADPNLRPGRATGATILMEGGSATYYIADRHFELSRLNVAGDMPLGTGRMLLLTALGACTLGWPDGEMSLGPGESALVPARLSGVRLSGRLSVLCAATPQREILREALGYRASSVAGLTE